MTTPIALSVVLITHNEAAHIRGCLESVAFADEWIVVDSGSTDATCEIARAMGASVTTTADWPGFGVQKGRALALARGRWVLSIDADERVTPALAACIREVVGRNGDRNADANAEANADAKGDATRTAPVAGYELSRLSNFCGQWMRHGDWYPDRVLRLARRSAARFSTDAVHERLSVDGPVGCLAGELLHHSMPTLDAALDKMNRYSSGRALDQARAGRTGGLAAALGHALWAFVRCYILRRGVLDGRLGFVLAAYVAEGSYYRHLKVGLLTRPAAVAEPAERLDRPHDAHR